MKIITATGNPKINERLRQEKEYEVIGKDIQYQEGILEVLEEISDIEGIILSNNLIEEIEFNLLISKIIDINKNIEIIVFLKEKDEEIEIFLNSKKIYKIYYLDNYESFFYNLNKKKTSNLDISKNIEDFKKIIYEERKISDSEKISINKNLVKEESYIENIVENKNIVISFSGNYGSGKSIMSILFAKYLSKRGNVLLIDCDFVNKSINTILGINKIPKDYDKTNILSSILKYKENLYILSSLEIFIENFNSIDYLYFLKCIEILKKNFDYIIIDTSSNYLKNKKNIIFTISDEIVFLIEPNLSEVKKANMYLEKIVKDYEIEESKINIIFNKTNKYKISEKVLNEIYSEKNIIGNIPYNEKFNFIINKNTVRYEDCEEKIFEKLLKNY